MKKKHTPTEKPQKATWRHGKATKTFGYTTIADRLRTFSWDQNALDDFYFFFYRVLCFFLYLDIVIGKWKHKIQIQISLPRFTCIITNLIVSNDSRYLASS